MSLYRRRHRHTDANVCVLDLEDDPVCQTQEELDYARQSRMGPGEEQARVSSTPPAFAKPGAGPIRTGPAAFLETYAMDDQGYEVIVGSEPFPTVHGAEAMLRWSERHLPLPAGHRYAVREVEL